MSNRNVEFKTTVISPVWGTFHKGDIGNVDAEFAKHVVDEIKVAKYTDEKRADGRDPRLVGAEEAAKYRKAQTREQEKRNQEAVDANQKQEAKLTAQADATAKGIRTTDHALPTSPPRKGDPGKLAPQKGVIGGTPAAASKAAPAAHEAAPAVHVAPTVTHRAPVAPAAPARAMAPARSATSSTQGAAKASGARAVPDKSPATKGAAKALRGGKRR